MKYEKGNWRVVRDCCTSGNCVTCMHRSPYGAAVRVTQGDGYSQAYAKHVAGNWQRYNAMAEPMPFKRYETDVVEGGNNGA